MSEPTAPPAYGTVTGDQGPPYPPTAGAMPSYPQEPPPKYEDHSSQKTGPPPQQPQQQQPYPTWQPGPYAAPPAGYQQPTTVTANTVVVRNMPNMWNAVSTTTQCNNCQQVVNTVTHPTTGLITWLSAGVVCLVGCWLGCCLIPFCIPELQDVEHRCPNCHKVLGVYQRVH